MRAGAPCNESRVFPVGIDLQGVHCEPYRVWVCSVINEEWRVAKIQGINKQGGWIFFLCRVEFSKIVKLDVSFIRDMRVYLGPRVKSSKP